MLICDGGTTYSKIYNVHTGDLEILPTKDLILKKDRWFQLATGHSTKHHCDKYINELVALAEGALTLVDEEDFVVLDIGSRDTKFVQIKKGQVNNLDWNTSCGGNLGFTLELLGNYYNIDYDTLNPTEEMVPVACGLLGIEKIFDEINKGLSPQLGVAKFINGMAYNTYNFCQKPHKIYLSGGLTQNICFVNSLAKYCEVHLLGRDVLIKGLLRLM